MRTEGQDQQDQRENDQPYQALHIAEALEPDIHIVRSVPRLAHDQTPYFLEG